MCQSGSVSKPEAELNLRSARAWHAPAPEFSIASIFYRVQYFYSLHSSYSSMTGSKKTTKPASGPRCFWTSVDNALMVEILRKEMEKGNKYGDKWVKPVWTSIERTLAVRGSQGEGIKTAAKCINHWANVRPSTSTSTSTNT